MGLAGTHRRLSMALEISSRCPDLAGHEATMRGARPVSATFTRRVRRDLARPERAGYAATSRAPRAQGISRHCARLLRASPDQICAA